MQPRYHRFIVWDMKKMLTEKFNICMMYLQRDARETYHTANYATEFDYWIWLLFWNAIRFVERSIIVASHYWLSSRQSRSRTEYGIESLKSTNDVPYIDNIDEEYDSYKFGKFCNCNITSKTYGCKCLRSVRSRKFRIYRILVQLHHKHSLSSGID